MLRTYLHYIFSIIPILSYVFLSVVLLMRKTGKLLLIAIVTMVITQILIGATRFPVFSESDIGNDSLGVVAFTLLGLCVFSKWDISNKSKRLFGFLLIGAYVVVQVSNWIWTLLYTDLMSMMGAGEIALSVFWELLWLSLFVLACVFFMNWMINPYKDEKTGEETDGAGTR